MDWKRSRSGSTTDIITTTCTKISQLLLLRTSRPCRIQRLQCARRDRFPSHLPSLRLSSQQRQRRRMCHVQQAGPSLCMIRIFRSTTRSRARTCRSPKGPSSTSTSSRSTERKLGFDFSSASDFCQGGAQEALRVSTSTVKSCHTQRRSMSTRTVPQARPTHFLPRKWCRVATTRWATRRFRQVSFSRCIPRIVQMLVLNPSRRKRF